MLLGARSLSCLSTQNGPTDPGRAQMTRATAILATVALLECLSAPVSAQELAKLAAARFPAPPRVDVDRSGASTSPNYRIECEEPGWVRWPPYSAAAVPIIGVGEARTVDRALDAARAQVARRLAEQLGGLVKAHVPGGDSLAPLIVPNAFVGVREEVQATESVIEDGPGICRTAMGYQVWTLTRVPWTIISRRLEALHVSLRGISWLSVAREAARNAPRPPPKWKLVLYTAGGSAYSLAKEGRNKTRWAAIAVTVGGGVLGFVYQGAAQTASKRAFGDSSNARIHSFNEQRAQFWTWRQVSFGLAAFAYGCSLLHAVAMDPMEARR